MEDDYLPEFDEFCRNPSIDSFLRFGRAVYSADIPFEAKKRMFYELFEIPFDEIIQACINLWSFIFILSDPEINNESAKMGVFNAVRSGNIPRRVLNEWFGALKHEKNIDPSIIIEISELLKKE